MAIVSFGRDTEGGVPADRVREVEVVTLPNVTGLVKDKMTGEEKDSWADLAASTNPVAIETERPLILGWQDRWIAKICLRDDLTCHTAFIIGLKE